MSRIIVLFTSICYGELHGNNALFAQSFVFRHNSKNPVAFISDPVLILKSFAHMYIAFYFISDFGSAKNVYQTELWIVTLA